MDLLLFSQFGKITPVADCFSVYFEPQMHWDQIYLPLLHIPQG
jgi:hypothetical protein